MDLSVPGLDPWARGGGAVSLRGRRARSAGGVPEWADGNTGGGSLGLRTHGRVGHARKRAGTRASMRGEKKHKKRAPPRADNKEKRGKEKIHDMWAPSFVPNFYGFYSERPPFDRNNRWLEILLHSRMHHRR